ncbi:MAG: MFS transporter [Chloroflexota bacterium]|nr:MAG: MFS transporter [Chloroflexota bacterium]
MPLRTPVHAALDRVRAWVARWGSVMPLLAAEFILWTGFGALLPVMPLYFTEQGVDLAYLGVVIAAWPAARLFTEPVFGYIADRTARVPLMVIGLLLASASVGAMVLWATPFAFVALRAASGLGTAIYDPAARGYLNDAAPEGRRGEVFGLYSAAQMGGILLGPAIGGLGTAMVGSFTFVLQLSAVTTLLAAVAVALRVREQPRPEPGGRRTRPDTPGSVMAEFPADLPGSREARPTGAPSPTSLRNRFIAAAILVNLAGYFGGGLYETIWALFVVDRGGSVELIGLTFAIFGLVTIILSPYGGRVVDRRGPFPFIVFGIVVMVAMMASYPFVHEPNLYVAMVALEAVGFAFLGPATYLVIARGTPEGRSSTAQGIVGSAGTVGTIVASLVAGFLAATDLSAPFFLGAGVASVLLLATVLVAGRALLDAAPARSPVTEASAAAD